MASYINQAKDIYKGFVNGVLPSSDDLVKDAKSMVLQHPPTWTTVLATEDLVTNPDGLDIFDIGTLDDEEPPVYTADPTKLNGMLAKNFRARGREFYTGEIKAGRKKFDLVATEDVTAGLTPAEVEAANVATAAAELLVRMGDPNNDPES